MFTALQIAAIIYLLQAFNVDPSAIATVSALLNATTAPQTALIDPAAAPAPQSAPTSAGAPQEAPKGHIVVVSEGYYLNHLDAPHCVAPASIPSWDAATQDCQFVQLGAFVYKADGTLDKAGDLVASTTDAGQNRVIHGTGISDGHYQFNFLLRAPASVVQFLSADAQTSVTINAQ